MKKAILLIFLSAFLTNSYSAIWYVNLTATGGNNGTSWTDAFVDLQDAISASAFGDEIWVALGTYKPTTTTTQSISFVIKNGTKVYGGFNGTETLLTQRDVNANLTILSGEIGTGASNDNSNNIVRFTSVGNQTRIDGFTITGGYANDALIVYGGGISSTASSPTIENCKFNGNYASSYGGAIDHRTSGTITIKNCVFFGNVAGSHGGALTKVAGTANISDCYFKSNQAGSGGAIRLTSGVTTIDRCIIAGNISDNSGSAMSFYDDSQLTLSNSLIVGNYSSFGLVIDCPLTNTFTQSIINCTIANNDQANTGPGTFSIRLNAISTIKNSIIWDNSGEVQVLGIIGIVDKCVIDGGLASGTNIITNNPFFINPSLTTAAPFDTSESNYNVQLISSTINYGDNSYVVGVGDLSNNTRIINAKVDLGAYEQTFCTSAIPISASGPTSVCDTGSVMFWIPGGIEFAWSTGASDSSITTSTPGIYSVTFVDTSGCRGTALDTFLVNSSPSPNVSYWGGALHTTTFSTYQWYFNGSPIVGATSMNLTPTNGTGQYSVVVTNSYGCTGTSSIYNFFLGFEEEDELNISIYPNPVSGNGTINIMSTSAGLSDVTICMMDMSGKKIFDKVFEEIPNQIPLQNLKSGVYILTIKSGLVGNNYRVIVL